MDIRKGGIHLVLIALLGCSALLLLAPSAPAATGTGTGQIEGTVTKAGTAEDLAGIEVCAYPPTAEPLGGEGEAALPEYCAKTETNGHYVIPALPAGAYDVEFAAPGESTLDYVTAYPQRRHHSHQGSYGNGVRSRRP
jgi:hypothetical protein